MIVITGATGFIGQRLLRKLVKLNSPERILALGWSNNPKKESEFLAKFRHDFGVKTLPVDLLTKENLINLPRSSGLVFHLAGTTDTASSDFSSNDFGTKNLLKALSPNKNTHIIFASTMVSFSGRKTYSHPITENTRPAATNGYGRSKLRAEEILKKEAAKKSFRLTIVRMPTVYGKGGRKDNFFEFLNKLIQKKSILSRLNLPGLTSFIYVDDAVDAMVKLAKKPPAPGKTNTFILSAEELSLQEVFQLIFKEKGVPYSPIKLPSLFWRFLSWGRQLLPYFEKIISPKTYNLFWRASLIVDDVIACDNSKLKKYLPSWKPTKLAEKIGEVLE